MKKKKMELWVKILMVVLLLLLIFVILTFRKFLILREITIQNEVDRQSENYYLKTYDIIDGITEIWIYGQTKMMKYTSIEEGKLIERTIYTNVDNQETWMIVNEPEQKVAVQIEYNEDAILIPGAGVNIGLPPSEEIWPLIQLSVITSIDSTRWNDKEAYKISFNFLDMEEHAIWIDKENYRAIGQMNGVSSDEDGNMYSDISTYSYGFDTLTEEEVMLPDLTGYTIKDTNGNIIEY